MGPALGSPGCAPGQRTKLCSDSVSETANTSFGLDGLVRRVQGKAQAELWGAPLCSPLPEQAEQRVSRQQQRQPPRHSQAQQGQDRGRGPATSLASDPDAGNLLAVLAGLELGPDLISWGSCLGAVTLLRVGNGRQPA